METYDGWSIYNSVLYDLTLMFQGNCTVNENYFGANKIQIICCYQIIHFSNIAIDIDIDIKKETKKINFIIYLF